MKKLLALLLITSFFSCQKTASDFEGIGGFDIGKDFSSMKSFKDFKKIMPDEFNVHEFVLSDKVGSVSNLNITIDNGKISAVTFANNSKTNTAELKKICEGMTEIKTPDTFQSNFPMNIKMYESPNKKVLLTIIENKFRSRKNGQAAYDYKYIDKKAAEKEVEETRKMIKNNLK